MKNPTERLSQSCKLCANTFEGEVISSHTSMMRALASWKSSVSRADVRVVYLKNSSHAALREMAVSLHLPPPEGHINQGCRVSRLVDRAQSASMEDMGPCYQPWETFSRMHMDILEQGTFLSRKGCCMFQIYKSRRILRKCHRCILYIDKLAGFRCWGSGLAYSQPCLLHTLQEAQPRRIHPPSITQVLAIRFCRSGSWELAFQAEQQQP